MLHSRSVDVKAFSPRCAPVCEGLKRSSLHRSVLELHLHDTFFMPNPEIRMIPSSVFKASDLQSLIVVNVWFINAMKDLEPHPFISPTIFSEVNETVGDHNDINDAVYDIWRTCRFLMWFKIRRNAGRQWRTALLLCLTMNSLLPFQSGYQKKKKTSLVCFRGSRSCNLAKPGEG